MIATAGIDTWSPCWYLDPDSSAAREMDRLARVPAARGSLMPEKVAGHRVGWNGTAGMLYAEGHPGDEGELLLPHLLPGARDDLVRELVAVGVPVPEGMARGGSPVLGTVDVDGFGGVRRCDATVDLRTGSRADGLAVLAGAAAMATVVPRAQASVYYAKDGSGAVETVYVHGCGGGRVLGRWYDKGLESEGRGQRGMRVRVEDQRRYPKGHRRDVGELTASYVRGKFCDRFLPMWRATKGVTVAGQMVIVEKLINQGNADAARARREDRRLRDDELALVKAVKLSGYLVARKYGAKLERTTEWRWQRELRDMGYVEADGAIEEVEVDLHAVMEQALDSATWGAEG